RDRGPGQCRPRHPRQPPRAAELPSRLLAYRRPRSSVPALLRHQHPRRAQHGAGGGLRRHTPARAAVACPRCARRRPHRPSRSPPRHVLSRSSPATHITALPHSPGQCGEPPRRSRNFPRHELHEALREFMASLPVYRTYVDADTGRIDPEDRTIVGRAAEAGRRNRPDLDPELFDFLYRLMTLDLRGHLESELVMRLQQISAAVMAKGVEDTAFYRYYRLVSLNEVGGSPGRFGVGVEEFHRLNARTPRAWPGTMVTPSPTATRRAAAP